MEVVIKIASIVNILHFIIICKCVLHILYISKVYNKVFTYRNFYFRKLITKHLLAHPNHTYTVIWNGIRSETDPFCLSKWSPFLWDSETTVLQKIRIRMATNVAGFSGVERQGTSQLQCLKSPFLVTLPPHLSRDDGFPDTPMMARGREGQCWDPRADRLTCSSQTKLDNGSHLFKQPSFLHYQTHAPHHYSLH